MEFFITIYFWIIERIGVFIQWIGGFSPILGIIILIIVLMFFNKFSKK